jgi:hypothetical protein
MSTDVDITNLALSHIGDEAQVESLNPPDPTEQAAQAARFYPMARDMLLEMHPWTFAVRRQVLAALLVNPLPGDWLYAYVLPDGCIRPLSTIQPVVPGVPGMPASYFGNGSGQQPYIVESASDGSGILYTNVSVPTLRFIFRETNTTRYTPMFIIALSRLLSSYLAGPIIKGETGIKVSQAEFKLFELEFNRAASKDSNASNRNISETLRPAWIRGRSFQQRGFYPSDWRYYT